MRRRPPSPWLYAIGPAVILITTAIAITLFVTGLLSLTPDTRFAVPGSNELELNSGKYILYWEYETSLNGVSYSAYSVPHPQPPDIVVTLRSQDGSRKVVLEETNTTNYQIGTRSGTSMYQFDVAEPGTYILTAEYRDLSDGPEVMLAVGQGNLVSVLLRSIPLGFGGFVVGVLILIWVFVKRRKAGRPI